MKKIFLFAAMACVLGSCGSGEPERNTMNPDGVNPADKTEVNDATLPLPEGAVAMPGKDPVCDMDRNSLWTEFSVNNSDTTWFCSPHCKETFDKDPSKYLSKQ